MSYYRNFDRVRGAAAQGNVDLTFFLSKVRLCVCMCAGVRWSEMAGKAGQRVRAFTVKAGAAQ
jgi:hypothetical protein